MLNQFKISSHWISEERLKKLVLFILGTHLVATIFSLGFHHFDEHFQILEFLNFKWGETSKAHLPWEYQEKIRSWFMPSFYYLVLTPLKSIGLDNPFLLSFIARIVSTILGVFSHLFLLDYLYRNTALKKLKTSHLFFISSLWFIPFIHARHSSENWGGSLFIIASVFFLRSINENKQNIKKFSLVFGILLGLAFLARFQVALFFIGGIYWLVKNIKEPTAILVRIILGFTLIVLIGVVIDFWGYNEWTLTSWNYFAVNLLENKVSHFGTSPWWDYFRLGVNRGIPPLSLVVFITFLVFLFHQFNNYWSLSSVTFLLGHIFIGHKELRFLFPLILLAPIFLTFYFVVFYEKNSLVVKRFVGISLFVNFLVLSFVVFKPANKAIDFYKYIYKNGKSINTVQTFGGNPFKMVGLELRFYQKKDIQFQDIKELNQINNNSYVFSNNGDKFFALQEKKECEVLYQSYPSFIMKMNIFNWVKRSRVWSLFYCK